MENVNENRKSYRVLCLDGGGVRGVYTAAVLKTVADSFKLRQTCDVGKLFDLIVGTSTGGILACGLAAGISLEQIIKLYTRYGANIFTSPAPNGKVLSFIWILGNLFKPANSSKPLEAALDEIFGDETVGQLYRRRSIGICLPAINMTTHKPRVFKTPHNPINQADCDLKVTEICLATSAAPLILPIAAITNPTRSEQRSYFCDGGLIANNPAMIGLIEALTMTPNDQPIEIISLGTCPNPQGDVVHSGNTHRGISAWKGGIGMLEVGMEAQSQFCTSSVCKLITELKKLGRDISFVRLPQTAPSSIQAKYLGMDNASKKSLDTLIELGTSDGMHILSHMREPKHELNLLQNIFERNQ